MTHCEHCYDGFYPVQEAAAVYGGAIITRMYACLCARGRARLKIALGAERVLLSDDIERLWPHGAARQDTHVLDALVNANVPPACFAWTIDSYRQRFGDEPKMEKLLTRGITWLEQPNTDRSDWLLFGDHGTGKTGFAVTLLRACVERGDSVMFWTARHLSIVWRATFGQSMLDAPNATREADLLASLVAPSVLVLDELGGAALSDFVESTMTLVIDQRQKQLRPTLLTVNLAASDEAAGKAHLRDRLTVLLGPTLCDRLRERAQWVSLFGKSKRQRWAGNLS